MRIVVVLLAVVIGLGLVIVIVGYLLPVKHVAMVSATIPAAPDQIWNAISDVRAYTAWRGDVTSVELLPESAGHVAWREVGKNGSISYVVQSAEPPHRLVTLITDKSLPVGGSWEYVIAGEGEGSRVQITERGEVYNPVFRFVSRFIMGHSATASDYLKALGARFGAEVVPTAG
jgi:uncharacterized protein YndB with AHSA1/START domain